MALISRKMLRARPQELGKIKIGQLGAVRQSQGGRAYRLPEKLDHFIVTTRDREPDQNGARGNFIRDERIHGKIGAEPTELEGHLMFDTPEENLHAEMVQYQGQTKIVSCDGEERTDLRNGACSACPRLEDPDVECGCKPYARLHIQLWADPIGFYRVFRTTSWESTNNIQSALEDYYDRFGSLYHLPVRLVIYPAKVSYTEGNQQKSSQAYMVGLVLAKSMQEVAEEMVKARRLQTATQAEMKRLSGAVLDEQKERDVEEAVVIADEFFPQDSVKASVESQSKLNALKEELGDGPVVDADYEIEEEAEAGEGDPEGTTDNPNGQREQTQPEPAEAESDEERRIALQHEIAGLMEEHAPHLLTDKDVRRQWTYRLVGKASPRTASVEDLERLIQAVKDGDTGAVAEDEEAPRTTPFDDDGDQEEMPI